MQQIVELVVRSCVKSLKLFVVLSLQSRKLTETHSENASIFSQVRNQRAITSHSNRKTWEFRALFSAWRATFET